jgi:hypothetical protein
MFGEKIEGIFDDFEGKNDENLTKKFCFVLQTKINLRKISK